MEISLQKRHESALRAKDQFVKKFDEEINEVHVKYFQGSVLWDKTDQAKNIIISVYKSRMLNN